MILGKSVCSSGFLSNFFFLQLVRTFGVNILCSDILLMHKTYRPSTFSVVLQLEDLLSKNMKMSK